MKKFTLFLFVVGFWASSSKLFSNPSVNQNMSVTKIIELNNKLSKYGRLLVTVRDLEPKKVYVNPTVDGVRSGTAPEDVKDEVLREKYRAKLEHNRKLIEEVNRHAAAKQELKVLRANLEVQIDDIGDHDIKKSYLTLLDAIEAQRKVEPISE